MPLVVRVFQFVKAFPTNPSLSMSFNYHYHVNLTQHFQAEDNGIRSSDGKLVEYSLSNFLRFRMAVSTTDIFPFVRNWLILNDIKGFLSFSCLQNDYYLHFSDGFGYRKRERVNNEECLCV